ncbi:tRNA synthetases class II-domain-containing protein [Echria macrotheca]|uniref:tRNA synthetases class II-domain-containing protein n=1 Tax=Echria macrotheca TaxID=438768 RepID=A0AAJ0BFN6_9PEZI|nr:tRNA synthetases class II-domain-containing protein [Echria macrotheca]
MAQSRVSLRRLCNYTSGTIRNASPRLAVTGLGCRTRFSHSSSQSGPQSTTAPSSQLPSGTRQKWADYNRFPEASNPCDFVEGNKVTVHGFLSRRRVQHSKLVFADIQLSNGPTIQVTSSVESAGAPEQQRHDALRAIPLHSPVSVTGIISKLYHQPRENALPQVTTDPGLSPSGISRIDMQLASIQPLNAFPGNIIVSKGVQFPPSARHLQIRFSDELRSRLSVRPQMALELRKTLDKLGFTEVETPILFKSTPEGAREFLVPTRRKGLAYALPQSPQQYKQMLMSAGIHRYFQFARCFRDEDLRADRQPEFTQLDLEMSFATGKDVMRAVESLVTDLFAALRTKYSLVRRGDAVYPVPKHSVSEADEQIPQWPALTPPFPRLSYHEAMTRFGSDKPDLRIPFEIQRVDHLLPPSFISMITDLPSPIVEAIHFRPSPSPSSQPSTTIPSFITTFMDSLPASLLHSPHGQPTPLIFDTSKPLSGLSSLGFEGSTSLTTSLFPDLQQNDILLFQARPYSSQHQGGSTPLGTLRTLLYHHAISHHLLPRSYEFKFTWITDFPMFTPSSTSPDADPGQGGSAGFSATHHPFTAPLTEDDINLLETDPLAARADHYDLVVNGVELGGGSRRIHVAEMQEYVMREILKMTDAGVAQFSHLLEALRAGCPPHAGFALGFDRLVAVLTHTDSVRDVIAFPKSMKGEDLCVKSPGRITKGQLATYQLSFAEKR